jgi:hypothetical protein
MTEYKTDVRSYEHRIKEKETLAGLYLRNGNYERLLVTAAELMALKQGLAEVEYQNAKAMM